MNNSDTYITDHPIIKEISIGDQFELNSGKIVTFVGYNENIIIGGNWYSFEMVDMYGLKYSYTIDLTYDVYNENHPFDIKHKYIPLKDKIEIL